MSPPRIWVRHDRHKTGVFILAGYGNTIIFNARYPPLKAKAPGKLKMTIKNALKLRYQT